tara:strand:+ start:159 stop:860 length:702 start_codon:yes stop_codon:yes gene_type:complete
MMASYKFQSVQGPTDPSLRRSEIEGYQPVSRIGEVVINAFVDSYEFGTLEEHIQAKDLSGAGGDTTIVETKPHFHEWATVTPGMICLSRKARNATFRNYVAAETATPVISCCACLPLMDEMQFYFAGVSRSKSIRPIDDGAGPQVDEYFTLAIGGMVTLLNNSNLPMYPGDVVEWTFLSEEKHSGGGVALKRGKRGPRRIGVQVADALSDKVIGRSLGFSKPGETFDLLLRGC